MISNHAAISPDNKKKKPALPSLLSNLRNAQAAIGRAADDLHEREARPLLGGSGGGRIAASSKQPQLNRAPLRSLSSSLRNYSQRFGSQWRKRSNSRRKKGQGVTIVPQSFFVTAGCFFFAFPVVFVLYILARHAVFGDEGDVSGGQAHIHEVPTSFSNKSGNELVELMDNVVDQPGDGIDAEEHDEKRSNNQIMKEEPPSLIESATSELGLDVKHDLTSGINQTVEIGEISHQSGNMKGSLMSANNDEQLKIDSNATKILLHNATGKDSKIILEPKEMKTSTILEELDEESSLEVEKTLSGDLSPISIRKDIAKNDSHSNEVVNEEGKAHGEKETNHNNLRRSRDEDE